MEPKDKYDLGVEPIRAHDGLLIPDVDTHDGVQQILNGGHPSGVDFDDYVCDFGGTIEGEGEE